VKEYYEVFKSILEDSMIKENLNLFINKGNQIFFNPRPLYSFSEIIWGAKILRKNGKFGTIRAVDKNSFIHYRFKLESGKILNFYQEIFESYKHIIINNLSVINSRDELEKFEDEMREIVINKYNQIAFSTQTDIYSYNRVKKIINLYMQNLVTMARELSNIRNRIVPLLSLPLDSQIFKSPDIFSDRELSYCGLSRNSSYGSLTLKKNYNYLQNLLIEKASSLSEKEKFYPVYFDLIWKNKDKNHRYCSWGNNLFETSFGDPL
jgi:hypothetical protein